MIKVYVAGPMSSLDPIKFLRNLNVGQEVCARLLEHGFSPFPLWSDMLIVMRANIDVQKIRDASLAWMDDADCLLMIGDWRNSVGAMAEHSLAAENDMPIFYSLRELLEAHSTERSAGAMVAEAEARSDD